MSANPASWGGVRFGLPEKLFVVAALVCAIVFFADLSAGAKLLNEFVTVVLGTIVLMRIVLHYARKLIWRLRNRLLAAYLFIAVIPILLLLVLAQVGTLLLTRQIGTYLVTAEVGRRVAMLKLTADRLAHTPLPVLAETIARSGYFLRERYPGLEILVRDAGGKEGRFPTDSQCKRPPRGHRDAAGIVARNGTFHLWARAETETTEAMLIVPVTRSFLAGLVPGLGDVTMRYIPRPEGGTARTIRIHAPVEGEPPPPDAPHAPAMPSLLQRLDWNVPGTVLHPLALWDEPQIADESVMLAMRSPISAVLGLLFQTRSQQEEDSGLGQRVAFYSLGVMFLLLQIVSVMVGISLSRSITMAVHNLYEGTTRVQEGDFVHRIPAPGTDQLAELGHSFNRMTENLARLLQSEKERQRMQAELEIASEVQNQLHPKSVPGLGRLRLTSRCTPARMVSGDYFDYQMVGDNRLALAIGDVAGKGISAALLMATLQSSMRSQLRHCAEDSSGNGRPPVISTARLVGNLNDQLHASTAPEKYATFFFSVYDDTTSTLHYTNAGHLPPVLFRGDTISRLDVNGMVVGAFPGIEYGESDIALETGDLLVCFTDGLTEPENAYGEMFGEERLIDLIARNLNLPEAEIVDLVADSVSQWTASSELYDDLTLLVARRF